MQSFVVAHHVRSVNRIGQVAEHLHLMLAFSPSSDSKISPIAFVSRLVSVNWWNVSLIQMILRFLWFKRLYLLWRWHQLYNWHCGFFRRIARYFILITTFLRCWLHSWRLVYFMWLFIKGRNTKLAKLFWTIFRNYFHGLIVRGQTYQKAACNFEALTEFLECIVFDAHWIWIFRNFRK